MVDSNTAADSLAEHGFAWRRALAGADCVEQLRCAVEAADGDDQPTSRAGVRYAARNLLATSLVADFAAGEAVQHAIKQLIGERAFPVRAILFDKLADANWGVGWHQDLMIPVRERVDTPGFSAWSAKHGVPHVKPPAEVLEQMLTLRLHLDDAGIENGPLQVISGSHQWGEVATTEVAGRVQQLPATICTAACGDALFMRPLLMHASAKARAPARRRVLHIEFATRGLPGGLRWPPLGDDW